MESTRLLPQLLLLVQVPSIYVPTAFCPGHFFTLTVCSKSTAPTHRPCPVSPFSEPSLSAQDELAFQWDIGNVNTPCQAQPEGHTVDSGQKDTMCPKTEGDQGPSERR